MIADTKKQHKPSGSDIEITGRFDQYRSSYWAAAVAILGLRYTPRPFWRKHWDDPNASHFDKHKYAGFAGLMMSAVTTFYALRTRDDMKSIFAEAAAWELGKDPKDVTFSDFSKSKNTIIQQTVQNYWKYNVRRFMVNSTFFMPFILQPIFKNQKWFQSMHAETGIDLGMGANAAYLFSDVMLRTITPFEEIQALIDRKINQSDHYADKFVSHDLLDLYERHAERGTVDSFLNKRGTEEWVTVERIFDRMADLINQTHKNVVPREYADFDFSKFIYLVGNGLIDPTHMDRSLAYIEIANRHEIGAVQKAAAQINKGVPLSKILEEYEITIPGEPAQAKEAAPTTIVSPVSVQSPSLDNHLRMGDRTNMGLAFQEKLDQQNRLPAEGISLQ